MIGVTVFGLFLTPVFYVLLRTITGMKPLVHHGSDISAAPVQGMSHEAGH
jgi:multidrug efflux pump